MTDLDQDIPQRACLKYLHTLPSLSVLCPCVLIPGMQPDWLSQPALLLCRHQAARLVSHGAQAASLHNKHMALQHPR